MNERKREREREREGERERERAEDVSQAILIPSHQVSRHSAVHGRG